MTQNELHDILKVGLKAVSAYNLQPWTFQFKQDQLIIFPKYIERGFLKGFRDTFLCSLGALLENLSEGARHYQYTLTYELLNPDMDLGQPLCRVTFSKIPNPENYDIRHVMERYTNRKMYRQDPVPAGTLAKIREIFAGPTREVIDVSGKTVFIDNCAKLERIRIANFGLNDELIDVISFNAKQAEDRRWGLDLRVLELPYFARLFLMAERNKFFRGVFGRNFMVQKFAERSTKKSLYGCPLLVAFKNTDTSAQAAVEDWKGIQKILNFLRQQGLNSQLMDVGPVIMKIREDFYNPREHKIVLEADEKIHQCIGTSLANVSTLLRVGYAEECRIKSLRKDPEEFFLPEITRAREKAKVIFFTFDFYSHYLRSIFLAEAVKDDFEIYFASSMDPKANQLVRDRGFKVVECKTIDAARMVKMENKMDHSWMDQQELEPIFLDQVRVLKELKPDMVISDFAITLGMAAEYTQTTCYSLIIGHLSQYSRMNRKAPEFHPAIRAMKAVRCPQWLLDFLTRIGEKMELRAMHKGIKKIRKKYRLSAREDYFDELRSEFNLITDIEDFSPMKNLPGNYSYIGPIFHQQDDLEEDIIARLDPGKSTILISLGTFLKSDALYAIFNDPLFREFNVVLAGSPGIPMAPEVLHKGFVNLNALLPRTDVLICHGGDATVYQSLSHGVPLLGLAFQGEQAWSLQRVALVNFGEELHMPLSPRDVYDKVRFWANRKRHESKRFETFAKKISLDETRRRFRENLMLLNRRTFCVFCHQGTLESSKEIVNVPSDDPGRKNEYFSMWRCSHCGSVHAMRIISHGERRGDPADQMGTNPLIMRRIESFFEWSRAGGIKRDSEILYAGSAEMTVWEIFRKHGVSKFDILQKHQESRTKPVFSRQYDFILLFNELENSDDPLELMENILKNLKPKGRVIVWSTDALRIDLANPVKYVHDLHQPYRPHLIAKNILFLLAQSAGLKQTALRHRDSSMVYVFERIK